MPRRVIVHKTKIPLVSVDDILFNEYFDPAYYIVGDSIVAYSTNGTSWSTYSITPSMLTVSGRGGFVVAGGYGGQNLQYSNSYGQFWSNATYSTLNQAIDSDYSIDTRRWVIGGYDDSFVGVIKYSDNGITFSNATGYGGEYKGNILWDGSKWTCVDEAGTDYNVWESVNGASWSVTATISVATFPRTIRGFVKGTSQSLYVCAANLPNSTSPSVLRRTMYSSDLISWTYSTISTHIAPNDLAYSTLYGRYVMVGDKQGGGTPGTSSIIYSNNGTTWITATPVTDRSWQSVCWSSDLSEFMAVSSDGWIAKSSDGISWATESNITSTALRDIKWIK